MFDRWIVGILALLGIILMLFGFGCTAPGATFEQRTEEVRIQTRALQDLGVKARLIFIWGTSHAGGQAFNISGSSGFGEIWIDPLDE